MQHYLTPICRSAPTVERMASTVGWGENCKWIWNFYEEQQAAAEHLVETNVRRCAFRESHESAIIVPYEGGNGLAEGILRSLSGAF